MTPLGSTWVQTLLLALCGYEHEHLLIAWRAVDFRGGHPSNNAPLTFNFVAANRFDEKPFLARSHDYTSLILREAVVS